MFATLWIIIVLLQFSAIEAQDVTSSSMRPMPRPDDISYVPQDHTCTLSPCTRRQILNLFTGGSCQDHVLRTACQYSPWKELDIQERINEVVRIVETYNEMHGWNVDPNAMLCIFAKEGAGLEPMLLSFSACGKSNTTDTGLGQVNAMSAGDMLCNNKFKSKHRMLKDFSCSVSWKKYVRPETDNQRGKIARESGLPYINTMLAYPEAQIEMSMAVLLQKTNGHGRPSWSDLRDYNGSDEKVAYANDVYNNCYEHLRGSDPRKSLSRLNGFKKVEAQREDIKSRCSQSLDRSLRPRPRPERKDEEKN